MAKKSYRIREGGIAWYVKRYGRVIIALILTAVVMATFIGANNELSHVENDENVKVEEVIAQEEKMLVNELQDFVPLDVPLDAELQEFIFAVSDDYGIDGKLVMAVIGQETNFVNKVGDSGDSIGLMQVQPEWHAERMARLEVSDLTDPYENVVVGIDYLAECLAKGDLEWGLMCYNGGPQHANEMTKKGIVTEYAESVIYLSENL